MSSLGERELQVGSRFVGTIRILALTHEAGIHPRLGFRVGCTLRDYEDPHDPAATLKGYTLLDLGGDVRLGEHGPAIGTLTWVGERANVCATTYPYEHQFALVCDLDPWRLSAIEKARAGKELALWFVLWPRLIKDGALIPSSVQAIRAEIPRDKWLAFLQHVGYGTYEVLEVHVPQYLESTYKRALEHLRDARRQLDLGHYSSSVGSARKAIELIAVTEDVPPKQEGFEKLLSSSLPPNRATAIAKIVMNTKHFLAQGVHETLQPDFTRAEALFALRVCQEFCVFFGEQLARRQTATAASSV